MALMQAPAKARARILCVGKYVSSNAYMLHIICMFIYVLQVGEFICICIRKYVSSVVAVSKGRRGAVSKGRRRESARARE
jgi:hypothetical protein